MYDRFDDAGKILIQKYIFLCISSYGLFNENLFVYKNVNLMFFSLQNPEIACSSMNK